MVRRTGVVGREKVVNRGLLAMQMLSQPHAELPPELLR